MANKYSNLYTTPADQPNGPRIPKANVPQQSGSQTTNVAVLEGASTSGDVLYLRRMIPGEILLSIDISHTVDSNITTANLVLRPTDGTSDITLLAGSALLDGTVNTTVAWTALANNAVPSNGKTYDLCWVTGANGVASVHTHVIHTANP
jgi:hypothetical protein